MWDLSQSPKVWNSDTHQRRSPRVPLKEVDIVQIGKRTLPNDPLEITFSDGHTGVYPIDELHRMLGREPLPQKIAWDNSLSLDEVKVPYESLRTKDGTKNLARLLHCYGFALVEGTPCVEERVDEVMDLIGPVRSTSLYGGTWHVRPTPIGKLSTDSAYLGDEILHHSDGNYLPHRAPYQTLHCMVAGTPGTGISSLIDGLAIGAALRQRHPEAYDLLATRPLQFQYLDGEHCLYQDQYVLEVNGAGELVAVNWNNYDRAMLPADPKLLDAVRKWDAMLQESQWQIDFTLQAGQTFIFDNLRTLHARKGQLEPGSPRHYYGAYLEDGVATAYRRPRTIPAPKDTISPKSSETSTKSVGDFRSDTKTQPDADMWKSITSTTFGDDCARECDTTKQLEAYVADMMGAEDAVLVASGTQGNLLAVAATCPRGAEVVLGSESHLHLWEAAGPSVLFGVAQRTVQMNEKGELPIEALIQSLELSDANDSHCAPTKLVAIENTSGARGGAVLSSEYMQGVSSLCKDRGLALHIDGARLLNAAAALASPGDDAKTAASRVFRGATTASLCLSKGLGCPGGAIIVGPSKTITEARRLRKLVGGSMRQAMGVLSAAGLHVLKERDWLQDLRRDHELMKQLVSGLKTMPEVDVFTYGGTNMCEVRVRPEVEDAVRKGDAITSYAKASGLRMDSYSRSGAGWRFVTHRSVTASQVEALLEAFEKGCKA